MYFNLNQVTAPQKEPLKKVYPLIEDKTIVDVKLTLIPGGFTNEAMGCLDSWATLNPKTGVVYLNCYATITEGSHTNRRIYQKIGVHSPKSHRYAQRGQQLIRQFF